MANWIEKIYSNTKEENAYINNIEKIDPVSTIKYLKKANKKKMNSESIYNSCIRSKLRIQSTQSGFKVIEFTNNKRKQVGKLIINKKVITYLMDIGMIVNDNGFLFKNNIKFILAKFI